MSPADLATLAKAFELALPVLATFLSGLLAQDKFSDRTNAIVAGAVIGAVAIVTAFLHGQLTGNAITDVGIVTTASMSLQATVLAPLHQFLKSSVFVYAPVTHQITAKRPAVKAPQSIALGTQATTQPVAAPVGNESQGG